MEKNQQAKVHSTMGTGLPDFDRVLQGINPGDNIVWQVDAIADYVPFVSYYCNKAIREKRDLIYFRFADHSCLLPEEIRADVHQLHPEAGFENFISEIFDVIEKHGVGACYVFECLSDLSADWYSDRMLANFFMLTCPYLYDFETTAYFALLRNHHMALAVNAIHHTAQIVIDVYKNKGKFFLHPLKVFKRFSGTMYMFHSWDPDNVFRTVTHSAIIGEILTSVPQPWLDFTVQHQDVWTRSFSLAQKYLASQTTVPEIKEEINNVTGRLIHMAVTHEERIFDLACRYFTLADLVDIGKRMIGTGLIGGKSVGMLLARAILKRQSSEWLDVLEPHDSFFIGSDVFYTYLITNGCWWLRRRFKRRLKQDNEYYDGREELIQKILKGTFPHEIMNQFKEMLNYFGQSPIIVRSSSLLEDAYGNAFSGKYDSIFCANQGTPQERLDNLLQAVRTVYASTLKKEALAYQAHWRLLEQDEQMALLVQRVSGIQYESLFFPQIAGVGFSYNPYVWNPAIDPRTGMLRLVFGLGTRAVDRVDDDYTRVVALNAPQMRPEANIDEVRRFAQKRVDLIDLKANNVKAYNFEQLVALARNIPLDLFASRDKELEARAREHRLQNIFSYILTFDTLLESTGFVEDMRTVLNVLQEAYQYPVDIEFTANFMEAHEQDNSGTRNYRINLLQCRPFQVKGALRDVNIPVHVNEEQLIFKTHGPIIGHSLATVVHQVIYVVGETYSRLNESDQYAIARLIGRLTHLAEKGKKERKNIVLIGPGRWGTTTPSLGVPVSFSEISGASVICELAAMHEGLIPDVSLGTHFFNDLVEMDILYLALYPEKKDYIINHKLLTSTPNRLGALLPEDSGWDYVVKVIEINGGTQKDAIYLNVNSLTQEGVCYFRY